ncbi:ectonucleotide pyrophosphatase/phosphodiesterase [Neobacillus sp. PS3-34]|uniref:alkaline phosphatase family protein n=1 Tax=Neobacillus sp. PS3-34 TaxID=3070678 RepID=UPI0027DEDFBD|nr:ectonucleotide pyrophosphatase/phosphodiesterase [Neobacillus sp. PS3-34]WML48263.1 ectonucleotide pyrophosphatase/phosphodiesterase [Neobacillus sp. PS3-34]
MNRLTRHLIVISFDCLSALDLPVLEKLPHFRELLEKGTYVPNVETIYPSVTYPCHTSIVTGNFPNKHGIINNTLLQPGNLSPDWNWYRDAIRGTTLYDEAKKAKMKTAALLWPVTGKANIDYNMPEIFANRPWHNQIFVSLMNGSPLYQLELNRLYGHIRNGLNQPELDDFVLESTIHTIKSKKPELLLVHFTDLDSQRHLYGFSSKEASNALLRHHDRLGKIIAALKSSDIYEDSTIVVLGDHSALDENKAINLNVLLNRQNLITVNKNGKLIGWKAYCKSCDGSAYIYIKDKNDTDTYNEVKRILLEMLKDPDNGIEDVISGKQAEEKGADGTCAFMVEARKGYYFLENFSGEFIKTISAADVTRDKKYTLATHGYSPGKEQYSTVLVAAGKGIRKNTVIPSIRLVDEGPTIARLLGLHLGVTDGRIIEEMLDYSNT